MKTKLVALGLLLLSLTLGVAQVPYKVETYPRLPSREALGRLNLVLAWRARLPLHGNRDGLASVQVIPGKGRPQLLVQTYSGAVSLLDGETGDRLWFTPAGIPYALAQPPGANEHSVFTSRRDFLYVLDRANGLQRVWTTQRVTKDREFGFHMKLAPSAAPALDADALYYPVGLRVVAYALPEYGLAAKVKEREKEKPGEAPAAYDEPLLPVYAWGNLIGDFVEHTPMLAGNQVAVVSVAGELVSLNKFDGKIRLSFKAGGGLASRPGQYESVAYFGADEGTVYAVNMESGRLQWRFLGEVPVAHPPAALDADVFVTTGRLGLRRLRRDSGRQVWVSRDADRFLAANQKFVYALDRAGTLLVLDGLRGTALAKYSLEDWKVPVTNELTDRIYLAANDGQIICLHYAENLAPRTMKTVEFGRPPEKKEDKKEEKKEEKKDDEEKKDEEKKEEKKGKDKKEEKEDKKEEKAAAAPGTADDPARAALRRREEPAWAWSPERQLALAPPRRGDRAAA